MTALYKILLALFLCSISTFVGIAQYENAATPYAAELSSAMQCAEFPEEADFETILNKLPFIEWKNVGSNGFSKPYDNKTYVIKCESSIPVSGYYFIECNYTMLEHLQLAIVKQNEIDNITDNIGFIAAKEKSQSLKPTFRVWLDQGQTSFIFYEKKRFSSASQRFTIYNTIAYTDQAKNNNILSGILLGIFLVLLGNGVISWLMLKSNLYAFYSIYLIGLLLIFMIAEGYFRLFNPNIQDQLYFTLYYAIFFALLMIGIIFVRVLPVFSTFPKLKRISIAIIAFAFLLLLFNHYTFIHVPNWPLWIYKISNSLILVIPLAVIVLSAYFFFKNKDRRALWIMGIFTLSFLFFIVFALLPFFSISHSNMQGFKWIILFDAIAFLLFLNRDFYITREENTKLNLRVLEEKHKATLEYLQGITFERTRIADYLHDEISSQLIFLKNTIISKKSLSLTSNEIAYKLDAIYNQVRHLSHSMHPISLEKYGLKKALEEHVLKLEDTYPDVIIDLEITLENASLNSNTEIFLYLSSLELLANSIKHTSSSKIHLYLFLKENNIILVYFDDGGGFDTNISNSNGLGLLNISRRAAALGGSFELYEIPNGVKHIIKLPVET